jgi:short-subunit dehydrogenase/acyl dehydratase/acyl carrier protein
MPKKMNKQFADFTVNDYIVFNKTFKIEEDYATFKMLSGDHNPLHHDEKYAQATPFSHPIVPMHLATLPLSRIAGMIFPGHRSLYLSTSINSIQPIHYNKPITYSAKIVAKSDSTQTLTVNTILFSHKTVLLQAEQLINVRDDHIPTALLPTLLDEITIQKMVPTALITGASGEIGRCIALSLAKKGFQLILQYHNNEKSIQSITKQCQAYGAKVTILKVDLSNPSELLKHAANIQTHKITHFIHAASTPLNSDFQQLMSSNYIALKNMTEMLLPNMLNMQFGKIILIGSSAIQAQPAGWEDYIAAKSSAVSYINHIDKHFRKHGIQAITLAPGFVGTSFSEAVRSKQDNFMLPEQVAESLLTILENHSVNNYYWLEVNMNLSGQYGFLTNEPALLSSITHKIQQEDETDSKQANSLKTQLDQITRNFFKLDHTFSLENARFEEFSHWNSLKHIQYLLEIEKQFKVNFHSKIISQTTTYQDLIQSIKQLVVTH